MHFTGKERDIESGLDNFGARYDSSSLGRFMSPDAFSIKLLSNPCLSVPMLQSGLLPGSGFVLADHPGVDRLGQPSRIFTLQWVVGSKAECPVGQGQKLTLSKPVTELLQLRVLRHGLLKDWNVGVGILP